MGRGMKRLLPQLSSVLLFEGFDDGIDLSIHLVVRQRTIGPEAEGKGYALGVLVDPFSLIHVEHVDTTKEGGSRLPDRVL